MLAKSNMQFRHNDPIFRSRSWDTSVCYDNDIGVLVSDLYHPSFSLLDFGHELLFGEPTMPQLGIVRLHRGQLHAISAPPRYLFPLQDP